jgi:flavodoxin I
MNIQLIYQTRGGHTRTVAEAMAAELGIPAIDINDPAVLAGTDLLFVGMGIYAGKADQNLMDYLDQLPQNQIRGAAVFSTSATGTDHMELAINLLEHKGIVVYPKHLSLRGQFFGLVSHGHPNAEDLEAARRFAREVADSFQG